MLHTAPHNLGAAAHRTANQAFVIHISPSACTLCNRSAREYRVSAMSQSLAFQCGSLQRLSKGSAKCCHSLRQTNFRLSPAVNRQRVHRRSTLIRAKEDPQEKGEKIDNRKMKDQTNKLVEGMKKGGIDSSTAQRILDTWEKTGATSTDALRKMLLGRSLKTVGVVLFQLLLDAGAAYGSYNSARYG